MNPYLIGAWICIGLVSVLTVLLFVFIFMMLSDRAKEARVEVTRSKPEPVEPDPYMAAKAEIDRIFDKAQAGFDGSLSQWEKRRG